VEESHAFNEHLIYNEVIPLTETLTSIFRYPVKSMGGSLLEATQLTDLGIPGDRCWTLKDEQRGGIKGGKRFPSLMGMHAALAAEPDATTPSPEVLITLANGTEFRSSDTDINDILSTAIGSPVTLWPLVPADQLAHYLRAPVPDNVDQEAALREVFARTADEPLPDLSAFPAELFTYESPPGTYFDAFPLLIMSTSALAAMQQHRTESNFDIRRFRPNLVIDTPTLGFAENAWVGKKIRIGSAVLHIELPCPRCVMTTHAFADLPKDPGVMRALVEANGGDLGVYASIVEAGEIKCGDKLTIIS